MAGSVKLISRPKHGRVLSQDVVGLRDGVDVCVSSSGSLKTDITSDFAMIIVADGLGGHPCGRSAAAITITTFLRMCVDLRAPPLAQAAAEAHRKLQLLSARKGHRACLGAAVAGVVLAEQEATYFSAGDVGIFHESLVGEGFKRCFEAERTSSGRLRNCIGGSFDEPATLQIFRRKASKKTLVCTDGLWELRGFSSSSNLLDAVSMLKLSIHEDLNDDALCVLMVWNG